MINLPCWLTSQDKYVIKNLIDNDEFSHFQNHESVASENDYFWEWLKEPIHGYKIIIEYDSCFVICIINGCELNHYMGDDLDELQIKATSSRIKRKIKKYVTEWETQQNNHTQLALNLSV
ncbi:hypothetical protein [Anabaena azotica]|uniref:Uncharacterized protein n=1 Tax=Anabaena azotica FACHB-119 TaxID=947527 RepID=A0ABR8D920_9NOST|nr:hypothetical protein [Anabaena azotica]MBD2503149.1 hypothetical protein [Anabaena azotica FACHB-119]